MRVLKGRVDEAELAALTLALLVLSRAAAAEPVARRELPRWWRPERSRGFTPAMSWRAAA
jgi:hypothetical protein